MADRLELLLRPLHPHHRSATTCASTQALWRRMRRRRHLSRRSIPAGIRSATRPITTRARLTQAADGSCARADRHAGRMDRGGELLLPPLRLSGPAARALRGASRLHRPGDAAQRDRQLRPRRAAGSLDQPHHLRLGRAGAGRPEARHVCLGRRADQLHHRRRLSRRERRRAGSTGRRTCTSSARTSSASTPSTGRPS